MTISFLKCQMKLMDLDATGKVHWYMPIKGFKRRQKKSQFSTLSPDSWFVCVEVLGPSQPNGVMLSMVSLPNHTFTGQA